VQRLSCHLLLLLLLLPLLLQVLPCVLLLLSTLQQPLLQQHLLLASGASYQPRPLAYRQQLQLQQRYLYPLGVS
jgi:hypothetical protein